MAEEKEIETETDRGSVSKKVADFALPSRNFS